MKRFKFLLLFFFLCTVKNMFAQELLPGISVENFGGKIIVSWQNGYEKTISNILIQRSYDSLKNYTTIGSVLNPQNRENGYADANPPYSKMYYRVSVSFEGGTYLISKPVRPVKIVTDTDSTQQNAIRFPWQVNPNNRPANMNAADSLMAAAKKNEITYPSQRIYTGRDNNVIVYLPEAAIKKYVVKFYDEFEKFLFELNKLNEEYLIVEKVNFVHAGWFHFEIYEGDKLVEKNRFFIAKDGKNGSEAGKKQGNNN